MWRRQMPVLPALEELSLACCALGPGDLAAVARCPALRELSLNGATGLKGLDL